MDQVYESGCFYHEVQKLIKTYTDIEIIVQSWQRQRVFSTVGIRKLAKSLQVYLDIDEIFKSIN
jgi:hypothetical protein